MLTTAPRISAIEVTIRSIAVQNRMNFIPHQATTNMQGIIFISRMRFEHDRRGRHVIAVFRFVLQFAMAQQGVFVDMDIHGAVTQIRAAQAHMTFIDGYRRTSADPQNISRMKRDRLLI